MTQTPCVWGRVPICAGGLCDPRRRDMAQPPAPGSRWARPSALPPVPRPAGGGSGADGLLAASAAAARLSALLADGPPALRARGSHSPRPAAPSPGRGGRRLGLRSLPPASLPRGPLTPRARPGRPPEGEGEGTSALFVTTESIVCEEPAPAGDRAERGAGAPDGGGARRGERGSREEGGRRGAAGL